MKMVNENKLKILAIGFLPPPLGGVSVSFKIFYDTISKHEDVDLTVANLTGTRKGKLFFKKAFVLFTQIWTHVVHCNIVMLYCATPQIPTLGLATLALCRVYNKLFILRKAAGTDYLALGFFSGRLSSFVAKRSDLFLAQTKHLVKLCQLRGFKNVHWYPTHRPAGKLLGFKSRCHRLVFIGQVRQSKGIFELIEAADGLPNGGLIDVYGPFFDGLSEDIFRNKAQIHYHGILAPDQVQEKLREYDAFVLPTKASTEGYPGAILEALSVGLPCISTIIGGIPEILDERCGILVPPGNADALKAAMHSMILDESLYRSLCKGAYDARNNFSAEYWTNWFIEKCKQLLIDKNIINK